MLLLFENTILEVLQQPQSGKFSQTFLCSRLPSPAVELCTCCACLLFPQSPRCHPESRTLLLLPPTSPSTVSWLGWPNPRNGQFSLKKTQTKKKKTSKTVSVPALLRELRVLVTRGPATRAVLSGRRRAALRRAAQGARLWPEEQKVAVVASGLGAGPGQRPGQGF